MSLRPDDFALGTAKWALMATVNKAIAEGKPFVLFDCQALRSTALSAPDLDPFGGLPELEDIAEPEIA